VDSPCKLLLTPRRETHFRIGELTYKLFDVGGQRSERRKWLNIFDSVTALVFLIAISECE
jgi:guanine nucleotide-binding protein G(i) subunit alpha